MIKCMIPVYEPINNKQEGHMTNNNDWWTVPSNAPDNEFSDPHEATSEGQNLHRWLP